MAQGNVLNLKAIRGAKPTSPCAACQVRDLSICNVLNSDELCHFTGIIDDVGAASGQALFFEGDPAEHLSSSGKAARGSTSCWPTVGG